MMNAVVIRLFLLAVLSAGDGASNSLPVHTVNLIADRDSVFRMLDNKKSEINLVAGEAVLLRVDARKAKSMNRDGSVHGLVLLDAQRKPVPGWNLLFKPGIQEMELMAPAEPGSYEAVCSVICSTHHDQMRLRVVVRAR